MMKIPNYQPGHVFKKHDNHPRGMVWDGVQFVPNTEDAIPATVNYAYFCEKWSWYERLSLKFEPFVEPIL